MTLTVGSLFTGIGGIDLGLERASMTVKWQCEIEPYCRKVLAKHWPNVPCYKDVRSLPDDIEPVDLICGGYPCQPFSLAGARRGTDDPRHLWPAFADVLRLLRPRWALLENVPGHLSLGFNEVLTDLASLGYDTEWTCIPAAAVGAPHLRWRLFVVAHTDEPRNSERRVEQQASGKSARSVVAYTDSQSQPGVTVDAITRSGELVPDSHTIGRTGWTGIFGPGWRGQPEDGGRWATEPDVGRVDHGIPHRMDRLRALGNAVVPQVAEFVGRRIVAQVELVEEKA